MNRKSITTVWLEAREQIKNKQLKEAEETLDHGLILISKHTLGGVADKDLLEGVKMETWKERFWVAIEKHIWPIRKDYVKNWKM